MSLGLITSRRDIGRGRSRRRGVKGTGRVGGEISLKCSVYQLFFYVFVLSYLGVLVQGQGQGQGNQAALVPRSGRGSSNSFLTPGPQDILPGAGNRLPLENYVQDDTSDTDPERYAFTAKQLQLHMTTTGISTIRIGDIYGWCQNGCQTIVIDRPLVIEAINPKQGAVWSLGRVPQPKVVVETGTLTLRNIYFVDIDEDSNLLNDVIFPKFFQIVPKAELMFEGCTFVARTRSSLVFRNTINFEDGISTEVPPPSTRPVNSTRKVIINSWNATSELLNSFTKQRSNPVSSGSIYFNNTSVVADIPRCYRGGVIAANSYDLVKYLNIPDILRIYMLDDMVMTLQQFPQTGVRGISLRNRDLVLYACNIVWDLDFLDMSVFLESNSKLSIEGNFQITNCKAIARDLWPQLFFPFLGFLQVGKGNNTVVIENVSLKGVQDNPLFNLASQFWRQDRSVLPRINFNQSAFDNFGSSQLTVIDEWNLYRRDWLETAVTYVPLENQDPEDDTAMYSMRNVTVIQESTFCVSSFRHHFVRDPQELRTALSDQEVEDIVIQHDMIMLSSQWPEADSQPEQGINITRKVTIRNCNPSTQIVWDLNNIYQTVYIQSGGYLRIQGNILFKNSFAAARRDFNFLLLGFFSVEEDGILELNNVTIRGTKPSPLHPGQKLNLPSNMEPRSPLIEYPLDNRKSIILNDWLFLKADYIKYKTGKNSYDLGYWQFIRVTVDYDVSKQSSGLLVGLSVGGVLMVLGLFAMFLYYWFCIKQQQKMSQFMQEQRERELPPLGPQWDRRQSTSVSLHDNTGEGHMSPFNQLKSYLNSNPYFENVFLDRVLGEGTFGKVWLGRFNGAEVAVKQMLIPIQSSDKNDKRRQMAVMETTISALLKHPNIIQTYHHSIQELKISQDGQRIVQGDENRMASIQEEGNGDPEEANLTSYIEVKIIQEYCDIGSVKQCAREGMFIWPDNTRKMNLILHVATDVARAMRHMHESNYIHGDLKASNVLLKATGDTHKFTSKVGDFGLSMQLDPNKTHVSNTFQGTLTHMSPEIIAFGKLSKPGDVYAYGIFLWELYTGEQVFRGMTKNMLSIEVTANNRRPEFPQKTPWYYQLLANRCWEADPYNRPDFEEILEELQDMQTKLNHTESQRPPAVTAPVVSVQQSGYTSNTGGVWNTPGQLPIRSNPNIPAMNLPPQPQAPVQPLRLQQGGGPPVIPPPPGQNRFVFDLSSNSQSHSQMISQSSEHHSTIPSFEMHNSQPYDNSIPIDFTESNENNFIPNHQPNERIGFEDSIKGLGQTQQILPQLGPQISDQINQQQRQRGNDEEDILSPSSNPVPSLPNGQLKPPPLSFFWNNNNNNGNEITPNSAKGGQSAPSRSFGVEMQQQLSQNQSQQQQQQQQAQDFQIEIPQTLAFLRAVKQEQDLQEERDRESSKVDKEVKMLQATSKSHLLQMESREGSLDEINSEER